MNNALTNKGMVILGDRMKADATKVVVVGTARGGTSLVAGVLAKLGVFMGEQASPPVYEDLKLSALFESEDIDSAKLLIEKYSGENEIWGWKRPSSINYLEKVNREFGKPAYIFIYKDVVSIAQRNAISMLDDVIPAMKRASDQYAKSIDFLSDHNSYVLLVSYDKALSNPAVFVDTVIEFCNMQPSGHERQSAIEFITPNPVDYLDQSRITKSQGRLGGVNKEGIFGWARYPHPSMRGTPKVEIYLNGEVIGDISADSYRKDLYDQYKENCAFTFEVPPSVIIKKGDELRAKVVDDVHDLDNSPFVV